MSCEEAATTIGDIAVRMQGVSKCYQIYDRPQDRLKQAIVPRMQRAVGREPTRYFHDFWALREVDLEVRRGETLGVVGRYILTPRVFHHLQRVRPGAGGEIQLTDAIAALVAEEDVFAFEFQGTRYDCGTKLGYLQANLQFALKHPEIGADFGKYLRGLGRRTPK